MTKRQRVEEALEKMYKYRYNVIDGTVLYTEQNDVSDVYKPHTDYEMNSILRKVDKEVGENISPAMYHSIISSDFAQKYHPIQHYFNEYLKEEYTKPIEGEIKKLAATVDVPNPTEFYISLKRWLVASVANGLTEKGCQNHTCIVLTGKMGTFKTSWLKNLCPPRLNPDYIMTGKIDLNRFQYQKVKLRAAAKIGFLGRKQRLQPKESHKKSSAPGSVKNPVG